MTRIALDLVKNKMQKSSILKVLLLILVLGLLIAGFSTLNKPVNINLPIPSPSQPTPNPQAQTDTYKVIRVIDGDTIEVQKNNKAVKVRYIGIDTPETDECFGKESAGENKRLVLNKDIRLETDVQELDKYNRLLAYVYVNDLFVNEELIKKGFAKVATFPPNVKYADKFIAAQKEAREQEKGLWKKEVCANPQNNGLQIQQQQVLPANSECLIKGNINASGEKIFHMPGQKYYEKTKVEESERERWFCTENEAIEAGWRKSKI